MYGTAGQGVLRPPGNSWPLMTLLMELPCLRLALTVRILRAYHLLPVDFDFLESSKLAGRLVFLFRNENQDGT